MSHLHYGRCRPMRKVDTMTRKMFREVTIPISVLGKLFLHSMPGCHEPLDHVWESLKAKRIAAIICLAGEDEILAKSHAYGEALRDGSVPCGVIRFEIPDYGVP